MGNLIKYLRHCISCIPPDSSEADAKSFLGVKMQSFLDEQIMYAWESITRYVLSTMRDSSSGKEEVILTFGSSPLVRKILSSALARGKKFRLVIIDTRPLNEGLQTLSHFCSDSGQKVDNDVCNEVGALANVQCIYSPLSGACFAMSKEGVTKVILGASCLLSNGSMLAPAGKMCLPYSFLSVTSLHITSMSHLHVIFGRIVIEESEDISDKPHFLFDSNCCVGFHHKVL